MSEILDDGLKSLIESTIAISESQLKEMNRIINNIIRNHIQEERQISYILDVLLGFLFVEEKKLRKVYFKLIDYTRTFNKELADDYTDIYKEMVLEEEIPPVKQKKLSVKEPEE